MDKDIKYYLFFIIIISTNLTTFEKELDWKMISLCATGASEIILNRMNLDLGTVCMKYEDIIAECPDNTEEMIVEHKNVDIQNYRKCYKKCEENEVRIGNICYSCKKGYKLIIKDTLFGPKPKTCIHENYNMELKPQIRKPEEVRERHCMANTTLVGDNCEKDCSAIGLMSFGPFCATNEEVYKAHQKNFLKKITSEAFKKIMEKILKFILKPAELALSQFKIIKDEFLEMIKLDDFNTNKWFLKANIKKRIEMLGRDYFSQKTTELAASYTVEYAEYILDVCPQVSSAIYDNIIKDEPINLQDGFAHYSSKAMDTFFNFFNVDDGGVIDLANNCFIDTKNLKDIDCLKSLVDLIGQFDPTDISTVYSIVLSYYANSCDIDVKPENSQKLVYSYNIMEDAGKSGQFPN